LARGVGHSRIISVRFPPLDRVPEQARGVGQFVAFADGEDEKPLAPVGRTDFRRRKDACRKAVAHADQSAGDFGEAEAEMMGDILEEDEGRFAFADDAGDMRPKMARILGTEALARDRKWLAWIARYAVRRITGFMRSA
jgi:acyl-CoA reductase-like NAD-dependent aldehyde dehydrogenase